MLTGGANSAEVIQMKELYKQGASPEQIAEALGKDPLVVGMLLKSQMDLGRKLTLEERFGDLKEVAINTLKDICQYGENESAKVTAAKVLIDEVDGNNGHGGNVINQFNYQEMAEKILQAKQRVDCVREKIKLKDSNDSVNLAVTSSIINKSPQFVKNTRIIDMEFEEVKS